MKAEMRHGPARVGADAAWPFPDQTDYFMSGSNKPSEIADLCDLGLNPGIAINNVSEETIRFIEDNADAIPKLFVDSGAFGEVKFHKKSPPTWPKPISDNEWLERLDGYHRIAVAMKRRACFVLPDKVANQEGTLERLERYVEQIRDVMIYSPAAILPIQKGAMSMSKFWEAEMHILWSRVLDLSWIRPGIPLKKDATSIEELQRFLRDAKANFVGAGRFGWIHFLGRGVYSPDFR